MATLDEIKIDALNTAGYTAGNINERELLWLEAQTSQSGLTLDEQWIFLLNANGYTSGNLNERQMVMFNDLSLTGSYNERLLGFWAAGGSLPP